MKRNDAIERVLRAWLRSHHSVIGDAEAFRLGASPQHVRAKVVRAEWSRLYWCVCVDAAAPPTPCQGLRAAFVATRGQGVISHYSAAWLWGLVKDPPSWPEISLPAHTSGGRRLQGIDFHRSRDLYLGHHALRQGIPVTNPLRTIIDLASTASPELLTAAVDQALSRRLVTVAGLEAEIDRLSRKGRPGVGILRQHLAGRGFLGVPPASVLEAKARRLVASLPVEPPSFECHAGPDLEYRIDIAWAALLFGVEVDGYAWHFTPEQTESDNIRRNRLRDLGWTLKVYTWRQVCDDPGRVAAEILDTYRRLADH